MIDKTILHVLATAKAYAALVGSLLTLCIANVPDAPAWLATGVALLTAFATWAIPNSAPEPTDAPVSDDEEH